MVEAFRDGKSPRYLIRDRDGLYRLTFRNRVKALDIEEVVIASHSPCQSPYVERVIGTLTDQRLFPVHPGSGQEKPEKSI
jgi:hypothetical protein